MFVIVLSILLCTSIPSDKTDSFWWNREETLTIGKRKVKMTRKLKVIGFLISCAIIILTAFFWEFLTLLYSKRVRNFLGIKEGGISLANE